jgi:hypothetical protein
VKIFPLLDSILLSLSPTIAGAITDYLYSTAESLYGHLSRNCDKVDTELPHDLVWHWYCQRSIRQVSTLQYQYVSTIAHRLAATSLLTKSSEALPLQGRVSLTPLEICQKLQRSIFAPTVNPGDLLELCCWCNDAGYIYFELTPQAIAIWLEYIHDLPIDEVLRSPAFARQGLSDSLAKPLPWRIELPTKQAVTVDIALYAHARCRSLLKLAQTENLIEITDNWQLNMQRWSICHIAKNQPPAVLTSIFEHPAEHRLIQVLMAVLDGIHSQSRQIDFTQQLKSSHPDADRHSIAQQLDRSIEKVKSPNWAKLTIDLAQSWLDFYRDCRIFGDIKSQNPHLAVARCGLTAIAHRYLQILLENYLGVRV